MKRDYKNQYNKSLAHTKKSIWTRRGDTLWKEEIYSKWGLSLPDGLTVLQFSWWFFGLDGELLSDCTLTFGLFLAWEADEPLVLEASKVDPDFISTKNSPNKSRQKN